MQHNCDTGKRDSEKLQTKNPNQSEDWELVSGNSSEFEITDPEIQETSSQPRVRADPPTVLSPESSRKSKKRLKVDTSKVLDINYSKDITSTPEEMSSGAEKASGDKDMQATYDAIEDSLYKDLDKGSAGGKGQHRVHQGNYRNKEKDPKVSVKDVPSSEDAKQ